MHDDDNVNRAVAYLAGYAVTLEKVCFNSLSECRNIICGANVKAETVPDLGDSMMMMTKKTSLLTSMRMHF